MDVVCNSNRNTSVFMYLVKKESQCQYCVEKLRQLSQSDANKPTKFEHQMEKSKSDLFNFPLSAGR